MLPARPVHGDEFVVGEGALRIVVAPPVPRVARHGVEIPPSTPWRLRHGCPRSPVRPKIRSFRIGSRPFHSASEAQALLDVAEPRRAHPRPSDTHATARDRGVRTPRRSRRRCSPRGPAPAGARSDTGPTRTTGPRRQGRPLACRASRRAGVPRSRGHRLSGLAASREHLPDLEAAAPSRATTTMQRSRLMKGEAHRAEDLLEEPKLGPRARSPRGHAGERHEPVILDEVEAEDRPALVARLDREEGGS